MGEARTETMATKAAPVATITERVRTGHHQDGEKKIIE